MEYQKIQTVFKRDENNIIIPSQFTKPEFEWLKNCKFRAEEKIDGTNIRVEIHFTEDGHMLMQFKGKTERAIIPPHLKEKLEYIFDDHALIRRVFNGDEPKHVTLYGEGYGAKIQNGGNYIKNDVDFMLFDAKIDNWWLDRDALENIANDLHISIVPIIGYMTVGEAIQYVDKGFKSTIAENPEYEAEGLVLKTPGNILLKNGERICLKIKTEDFRKFRNRYGSLNYAFENGNLVIRTNVKQEVNPKYDE